MLAKILTLTMSNSKFETMNTWSLSIDQIFFLQIITEIAEIHAISSILKKIGFYPAIMKKNSAAFVSALNDVR